jgi:hypothetical protein
VHKGQKAATKTNLGYWSIGVQERNSIQQLLLALPGLTFRALELTTIALVPTKELGLLGVWI